MKRYQIIERFISKLGGPRSGNWGHAGRPGKRGGSMPKGGSSTFGSSPVTSATPLGYREKGVNDSVILEFSDGTRGIFKDEKMAVGCVESEILVHEFSESLGWGLVPETIEFSESGKRGSLQRWVDNSQTAMEYTGQINPHTRENYERMRVMDGVLNNFDRHDGNFLYANGGKELWAIDNGAAFNIGWHGIKGADSYDYKPKIDPAFFGSDAASDLAKWSRTPAAKKFITSVSSMISPGHASRLQDFLDNDLPRIVSGGSSW